MEKLCLHCNKSFFITENEKRIYNELDFPYQEICFECRVALHFNFWPFGKFRIGKSDLSGE
jgi:hypothetical protein